MAESRKREGRLSVPERSYVDTPVDYDWDDEPVDPDDALSRWLDDFRAGRVEQPNVLPRNPEVEA